MLREASSEHDLIPFSVEVGGTLVRGVRGGAGRTALLVHGTAGSWRNFRQWFPVLLPRCHVIAPDLPGFGESSVPSVRPRLAAWGEILHALTDELHATPEVLIGLGLGTSVALAYLDAADASGARPLLDRLVLHTPPAWPGAVRPAVRWGVSLLGSPVLFPLLQLILLRQAVRDWYVRTLVAGPDMSDEDLHELREDFSRASLRVLRGLAVDAVRADFRPLLSEVQAPTLVLAGDGDPFVEVARLRQLETIMPRATVVVQPEAGHGWTQDTVAEHQRLLAQFLG
ncbi:MAG: alpha/beta fold hydrolase [Chloroflexi bacterium]|nr:alpha/beta fold hydrolase [Chloroflexota bacterium]